MEHLGCFPGGSALKGFERSRVSYVNVLISFDYTLTSAVAASSVVSVAIFPMAYFAILLE